MASQSNLQVEYTSTEDLEPFTEASVDEGVIRALKGLASKDWETQASALKLVRRLVVHSGTTLKKYDVLRITEEVVGTMSSLRSVLAKKAMLALKDIVVHLKYKIEPKMAIILPPLLQRATGNNRFLSATAQDVIEEMSMHCAGNRLVSSILDSSRNKSALLRAKSAQFLQRTMHAMSNQQLKKQREHEKIIRAVGRFVCDANPQTREAGRGLARMLEDKGIITETEMTKILGANKSDEIMSSMRHGGVTTKSPVARSSTQRHQASQKRTGSVSSLAVTESGSGAVSPVQELARRLASQSKRSPKKVSQKSYRLRHRVTRIE